MLTDMATVSPVYESRIAVLGIANRYQYVLLFFQMLQPYEGSGNPCCTKLGKDSIKISESDLTNYKTNADMMEAEADWFIAEK